jgi:cell division protein FtsW
MLAKKPGEMVLLWGALLLLCGQAAANMMMVTGLLPVIGVPLPFISYGGTSLLVNLGVVAVSLPILSRVVKEAQAEKENDGELPPPSSPLRRKRSFLRAVR